jgi:integrase
MTNELTTTQQTGAVMSVERREDNLRVLLGSKSENTQDQIESTWKKLYKKWCDKNGYDRWQTDAVQARMFLEAHPARPSTQRARLSHLRTVIGLYADTTGDANLRFCYDLLKRYRLPSDANSPLYAEPRKRKDKRALRADEIYMELSREWGTPILTDRNRAIIALLFYAALRRSEVCNLTWRDINFNEMLIMVRGAKHRKADHIDTVALMPTAAEYLLKWRARCPEEQVTVFCRISKGGKLLADKPLSGETIREVCGTFMPHDGRRTFGTRAAEAGTPTNYIQKQFRHASPAMTLEYAKYVEAKDLRDKLKLGY